MLEVAAVVVAGTEEVLPEILVSSSLLSLTALFCGRWGRSLGSYMTVRILDKTSGSNCKCSFNCGGLVSQHFMR